MQREREFPDGQSPMVPGLDSANVHFKITVGTTATVTKHRVENIRSLNLFVLTRPSEDDLSFEIGGMNGWRTISLKGKMFKPSRTFRLTCSSSDLASLSTIRPSYQEIVERNERAAWTPYLAVTLKTEAGGRPRLQLVGAHRP